MRFCAHYEMCVCVRLILFISSRISALTTESFKVCKFSVITSNRSSMCFSIEDCCDGSVLAMHSKKLLRCVKMPRMAKEETVFCRQSTHWNSRMSFYGDFCSLH